jgi:transcriptional regulator with XRE-family HTH domain
VTGPEIERCLEAIGWTRRELGRRLDVDKTQVLRWTTGGYQIPDATARWLRQVARWHDDHPAPPYWQR